MRKESVKQDNKENQVIEQIENWLYQPEEEKFDEGIGNWERRGMAANLGYNNYFESPLNNEIVLSSYITVKSSIISHWPPFPLCVAFHW
jgi:hypothetical protein